jgi:hypothetical protein
MTPSIYIPSSAKTKVIFWPLLFLMEPHTGEMRRPRTSFQAEYGTLGGRGPRLEARPCYRVCTRLWSLDQFVFTPGQSGGSGSGSAMRPLRRGPARRTTITKTTAALAAADATAIAAIQPQGRIGREINMLEKHLSSPRDVPTKRSKS